MFGEESAGPVLRAELLSVGRVRSFVVLSGHPPRPTYIINPSWLPTFPSCMFGEAATGSKAPVLHSSYARTRGCLANFDCSVTLPPSSLHRENRDWVTNLHVCTSKQSKQCAWPSAQLPARRCRILCPKDHLNESNTSHKAALSDSRTFGRSSVRAPALW